MIPTFPRPAQNRYCIWAVYCSLVLFTLNLPLVRIQASPGAFYTGKGANTGAGTVRPEQEHQQIQQLEPGKRIERTLTGDQAHSYQLALAAGQYVKLVVDQYGIDLEVKLFGPGGDQIMEFDSERTPQGQESVSWVGEEVGSYRLGVVAKQKDAVTGRYGIQVVDLRPATENDRALHEARKLRP